MNAPAGGDRPGSDVKFVVRSGAIGDVNRGAGETGAASSLVLSAATTTSPTFFVTYDLDSQSRLTRQVSGEPRPTIVAHGIKRFTQTCNDTPSTAITVLMQVDGLGGGAVSVSPPLTVTLRNQLACP